MQERNVRCFVSDDYMNIAISVEIILRYVAIGK